MNALREPGAVNNALFELIAPLGWNPIGLTGDFRAYGKGVPTPVPTWARSMESTIADLTLRMPQRFSYLRRDAPTESTMKISEAAAASGCHLETIRYYERSGRPCAPVFRPYCSPSLDDDRLAPGSYLVGITHPSPGSYLVGQDSEFKSRFHHAMVDEVCANLPAFKEGHHDLEIR